jgi:hypothetical protein
MILRLVDGGIPSFEWKLKRFEIIRSDEEINELKTKVDSGELDQKSAFKKKYEYKEDSMMNLDLYRKILQKLPNKPGCLVLAKVDKNNKMIILEIFKSEIDLREDFKHSKKQSKAEEIDRYSWLKNLSQEEEIKEVRFLIAKAA